MKKTACLLIILCVFLVFGGCKKEEAPLKKAGAVKLQPIDINHHTSEGIVVKEPEETKKAEQEVYTYSAKGRRDPFLSLVTVPKEKPAKPKEKPAKRKEIRLMGIAWDEEKYYALITLPDNRSFTITEGMALGPYGGKVQKITKDRVIIREYIKDHRGTIRPKDSVLKLR